MRRLAIVLILSGCGGDDRPPSVTGEHPAGMNAPHTVLGVGSSAKTATIRSGVVRQIPSLMRPPMLGDAPTGSLKVSLDGIELPVRDGRFEIDRTGWFSITDGRTRVLANVTPDFGELTLPIVSTEAPGMPTPDHATVVLQLLNESGSAITGAIGEDKPGVIGPCYDKSSDVMNDKLPSTGTRGTIAYLQIDPRAGATFRVQVVVGARPVVAEVPIAGGTVTFMRAPID
jgi:hypothetical protein